MKIKKAKFILVALLGLSFLSSLTPAHAIRGGTPALGNQIVVGLLANQFGTTISCSGALVAPRIVMTAAHCLTKPVENLWIAEPGTDVRDTSTKRIQGERYFIPTNFSESNFPFQNDFGIVILKSGFSNVKTLDIASLDDVKKWSNEERQVTHIGYGCTDLVDAPPCRMTSPIPNQFTTQLSKTIPIQFNSLILDTFSATKISIEKTICGGDSGSPLLIESSGKTVYIGAQSSSNGAGCTKTCDFVCVATQGLPSANNDLVSAAFKYVATSSLTPTQTNLSVKKSTIICVKGKSVKKVTAVKPKCPSGYKVKK